jgi:acyl-CoA synthetase (AMP-forming)/AMP-acid ligase II
MAASDAWARRATPADLARHYRDNGWWTDATLGTSIAAGLDGMGDIRFNVHSQVRPWSGTGGDVDRAARSLAAALISRGIGPGDIVVMQLPNWVEAAITFCAVAYVGAVVVPVVHFYGAKEVSYILRVTQPAAVVTPTEFSRLDYLAIYKELLPGGPAGGPLWLVAGAPQATALPAGATRFEELLDCAPLSAPVPADPDSPALVAFTSGTTRDPKGVVHSHRTIGYEARQLNGLYPLGGPPPITGAPVGHFIGLLNGFLVPFQRRSQIELIDVWKPAEVLSLMISEGLGFAGGSTYFLTSLLDDPSFTPAHLAGMPYVGLGGSTVPLAVTRRATSLGIKVYRSYGSTEHPTITGCTLSDPEEKRLTTDGRCLPGSQIRLDAAGEILSRGPELFLGYTDPELTSTVLDADGWYHTGDVGQIDDEGYLTITDRLSDFIIRGGENISALEIEDLMLQMEGVADVSVVAAPDERLGEHAAAIILAAPGHPVPSLEEIRAHLRQAGLARQKWPESVYEVPEFPRTASGKVQRYILRQQLRRGELRPPR